jgi:hypothetical protein
MPSGYTSCPNPKNSTNLNVNFTAPKMIDGQDPASVNPMKILDTHEAIGYSTNSEV